MTDEEFELLKKIHKKLCHINSNLIAFVFIAMVLAVLF